MVTGHNLFEHITLNPARGELRAQGVVDRLQPAQATA